jgi:Uncharacterised nucleotidyltransferase
MMPRSDAGPIGSPGPSELAGFGYAAAVRVRRARLDAAAVEVSAALGSRGIRCVLLKGPVTADWLYPDQRLPHCYGDIDLLVSPAEIPDAAASLTALGYLASRRIPVDPDLRALLHAQDWTRQADAVRLDLHWRLPGAEADPVAVWEALVGCADVMALDEGEILTLGPIARLVALALHVTQRGPGAAKALDDLLRGLSITPDASWRAAFDLAGALCAGPAMVAGLRSNEPGRDLADRLGLPGTSLRFLLGPPELVPRGTTRLLRIATAVGWPARLSIAKRGLRPSTEAIREIYPFASRGAWAVVLVRSWHVVTAPGRILLAVITLCRAARRARPAVERAGVD